MLKLPKVAVRATAKRKFDAWIASFSLVNALPIAVELQRLLRDEKKRRKGLEKKR